jgi:serine protease Do
MDVNLSSVKNRLTGVRALVFALAVALASGAGFEVMKNASAQQSQLPSPADLSRTFISVAKQVKPAVVNIDVVEKAKRSSSMRLPEGFPQIPGFPPLEGQPRRQRGTGSGVIISADGYILTNNHVAADADQINVKLADGRELKARRIGTDPETDLAVIKIDAQGLPFAKLGNSDSLEQGEWVIALGSPFGLDQTMTAGIVSAIGRALPGSQFTPFIQTDASINPGNSGGPLVNMEGEVVGINTLIFSQSGTSSGVGFAIPSNLANKVYAQLVKGGKVTRGYLGVILSPVTPAIARTVGFEGKEGVLVNDIAKEDSPAAKAGLRSGDVITEFEGKPVKTPSQLTELVADTPVGKPAQLKFVRDGRVQTATVNLGERPGISENTSPRNDRGDGEEENGSLLGISTMAVTPDVASELKLKIPTGVVIQNVQPDSPAAEAGLRRGDVIHRINRMPITNRQDMVRAMSAIRQEKEIGIQIERGGALSFVTVTLE